MLGLALCFSEMKRILQLFFAGNVLHLRPTVRAGTTPAASGVPRLVPDVDHEALSAGAAATVEPRKRGAVRDERRGCAQISVRTRTRRRI